MESEVSLSIVLEMLEMEKKKAIDNSSSFATAQEELKKIEEERQKIISGDKEAVNRTLEKHKEHFIKK